MFENDDLENATIRTFHTKEEAQEDLEDSVRDCVQVGSEVDWV